MKQPHLVIPTTGARHLFPLGANTLMTVGAKLIIPTPNKEGAYRFPDGEVYLRVPGLKQAKRVTVIHSGYPDPNGGLIELYMLLAIIGQGSRHCAINVIFTAIPYARQDKAYYDGELNAAKTLLDTLRVHYDVRRIMTIDAHFANERWTKRFVPSFINISATELLMHDALMNDPDIVFMAPDAGSTRRIHIKGAKKHRQNSYSVTVDVGASFAEKIKGRTVGVVDDILATGTTLERFYREVKKMGAKKVVALITHGVNPEGIQRTQALYDHLYLTDTINRPQANVTVDSLIWKLIVRSMNENV